MKSLADLQKWIRENRADVQIESGPKKLSITIDNMRGKDDRFVEKSGDDLSEVLSAAADIYLSDEGLVDDNEDLE